MHFLKSDVDRFLPNRKGEYEMKKTCMNCKKYHATLSDGEGAFHIHNWCEQWKTVLDAYALANKTDSENCFYSDLETGKAFCYMYEAVDAPFFSDEWFDSKEKKLLKADRDLTNKEIEISGCVEVPLEMTLDEFSDAFIDWIESKGWHFGGGFKEVSEEENTK